MAKLTDDQLAAILANEEAGAVGFHNSTLADDQEAALDYYYGEPFGDEEEGRSQVVTRDVAEVVDHMTVSVLRTFVSGDRVVEFEPKSPEQEEAADDATEAVHYWFSRKQNGYRVLHDWLKAGLIEKIGVVKTACETETKVQRDTLEGVPAEALPLIEQEGGKVIAATPTAADEFDEPVAFSVTIEREVTTKTYRDYTIPSEEFLFAKRTRDEESADYLAHRCRKTRSDLVEMGFDRETIDSLPSDNGDAEHDHRARNRHEDEDFGDRSASLDPAMREVWLLEEYVRIDRDGDGRAELLMVQRVGKTILHVEEVDEQPFVVFTPFPMQHRLVGQSLADKVMDIQRGRSVLLRQTYDSLYQANAPRVLVNEDSMTEDTVGDLLTVRPGGLIRYKGAQPPVPYTIPNAAAASLPIIELLMGERESRTGITRLNQGLDADSLNKTATGTALLQAQGQQIEEYIARNFAECVARLFAKKLRLMRKHAEQPMPIRKGGQFKQVDPRSWAEDMDLTIQVGLGSGRKDQRLIYRQQILQMQMEGFAAGLVEPKHIFNSVQGLVADMGLGQGADYMPDPSAPPDPNEPPKQPKPDPEMLKVQAQAQEAQAKLQLDQQKAAADMQMREQEAALKLELAREEAALKAQLERDKAAREYELAVAKMDAELQLARERMAMEREIASERAEYDAAAKTEAAKLSSNREGGSLAE